MPRKGPAPKRPIVTDPVFGSALVTQLVNKVLLDGKKSTARKVVYDALTYMQEKTKAENPVELFDTALRNVGPAMEIRSRRVGGANYQVPREVRPERKQALAFRWILAAARARKGMPMYKRLGEELLQAANNEGPAVKKREDTHRMAESNKAFAHFAW